jgi:hypothetical protein
MILDGQEARIADVAVEHDVVLRETQTARPDERPLVIRGDPLLLADAEGDAMHATVVGRPSQVEARGMTMDGAKIELDRPTNRLWIDGAGNMSLPVRRGLDGEVAAAEQTLRVTWQGRMNFDGSVMRFERSVVARGESQTLKTETLDVELKNRVSFAQSMPRDARDQQEKTEVHQITCRGGVFLDNVTIEEGERTSIERMQIRDLVINQTSGDMRAQGPGWLTSVRLGGATDPLAGPSPNKPAAAVPPVGADAAGPVAGAEERRLNFLRVDFQRAMTGNTIRREVTFHGKVRAVHGPVPYWDEVIDADDPDGLGESGVLLNCDELTVVEANPSRKGRGPIELAAEGSSLVEGRAFTARAHRITYAQAKELLILEGGGHSDAKLFRQTSIGGPASTAAARRILYWRSSNRVEVDDARMIDLSQFGKGKKK